MSEVNTIHGKPRLRHWWDVCKALVSGAIAGLFGSFIVQAIYDVAPESPAEAQLRWGFAAGCAILLGMIVHYTNKVERKCPKCGANWSLDPTEQVLNLDTRYAIETKTDRETRGSGNTRQERTTDLKRTYRIETYDRIHVCSACGEEMTRFAKDQTLVSEEVTSRTPWQYTR